MILLLCYEVQSSKHVAAIKNIEITSSCVDHNQKNIKNNLFLCEK